MLKHLIIVVGVSGLGAFAAAQPLAKEGDPVERYDGEKIVRVEVRSAADLRVLHGLGADFWCEARRGENEVRLSAEAAEALRESGIPFEVVVDDVQVVVDAERAHLARIWGPGGAGGPGQDQDWFADYKPLAAISDYLDELVALRPDLAMRFSIGESLEGRDIFGVRITSAHPGQGRGCKPALFLNATQHAREWIAPMNVMFVADVLVRSYGSDPYITELVDNVEFLIVPVVNPDGYEYTWTTSRMWRKNRRLNAGGTYGVDLNRNWAHQWGVSLPHGSAGSSNPGSNVYWGTGPFSEPETERVRDFVLAKANIRAHNDVHSFGQMILFPWGHTGVPSTEHSTFSALGQVMRTRILGVHGRSYMPGTFYSVLYPASGVANDWMFAARGVHSFLYELRGGAFNPPATDIRPAAEETLPATLYKAEWIMDRFPFRADFNGDCIYNVDDFIAFIDAFAAGDPAADFDGNGLFNVDDFTAFVDAFATGR